MISVTFIGKRHLGSDVYSFDFQSQKHVRFIAGQFIELLLPHDRPDDRGTKRWFTLSSAPEEDQLTITTRIVSEQPSTFKKALFSLENGQELSMASPMGDFVLPIDSGIPLTFVAGGIGCTPFHSIIKHLQTSREKRDIRLLYAVQSKESAVFIDTFDKLGDNFSIYESQTCGRLRAEDIIEFSRGDRREYFYISGPEPMVEALEKSLLDKDIEKNRLHGDFFPGYQPI